LRQVSFSDKYSFGEQSPPRQLIYQVYRVFLTRLIGKSYNFGANGKNVSRGEFENGTFRARPQHKKGEPSQKLMHSLERAWDTVAPK